MAVVETRDRASIRQALHANPLAHVYHLGDLDDAFWPHTRWWLTDGAGRRDVVLYFDLYTPPILLALSDDAPAMASLLLELRRELPAHCYAHLGVGVMERLGPAFDADAHGRHLRMGWTRPEAVASVDVGAARRLSQADAPALEELYAEVQARQPEGGVVFTRAMLDLGPYFGVFEGGRLVSAAGVHVHSRRERVAAVANVATRVEARGRGLATQVTAAVCQALTPTADHVGLNVRADNAAAVRIYLRLGFETVVEYDEVTLWKRSGG